jgi:hypothetical protein
VFQPPRSSGGVIRSGHGGSQATRRGGCRSRALNQGSASYFTRPGVGGGGRARLVSLRGRVSSSAANTFAPADEWGDQNNFGEDDSRSVRSASILTDPVHPLVHVPIVCSVCSIAII